MRPAEFLNPGAEMGFSLFAAFAVGLAGALVASTALVPFVVGLFGRRDIP